MGATLTPIKQFDRREQVRKFYAREQRLSLVSPASKLLLTHRFAIPTATIASGLFPTIVLGRPITFQTRIIVTGVPLGTVFLAIACPSPNPKWSRRYP